MKRLFLFLFFALCSSLSAATQPNVLVIIADDLGHADIGVHLAGIHASFGRAA